MYPNIRWIKATYGRPPKPDHEGLTQIEVQGKVRGKARDALLDMAGDLVGTDGLVALYVPEGTEDGYMPGALRGRIIGAVQLVPMPPSKKVEDYFAFDLDGTLRWPIGWPARLVYSPPIAECPTLRDHVETLFGSGSFFGYAARLHYGPFQLEQAMRERLNEDFSEFTRLV